MKVENSQAMESMKSNEDLMLFTDNLQEFDEALSRNMFKCRDFTIKLEVHGAGGHIAHCRVVDDRFSRPRNSKKKGKKQLSDKHS